MRSAVAHLPWAARLLAVLACEQTSRRIAKPRAAIGRTWVWTARRSERPCVPPSVPTFPPGRACLAWDGLCAESAACQSSAFCRFTFLPRPRVYTQFPYPANAPAPGGRGNTDERRYTQINKKRDYPPLSGVHRRLSAFIRVPLPPTKESFRPWARAPICPWRRGRPCRPRSRRRSPASPPSGRATGRS